MVGNNKNKADKCGIIYSVVLFLIMVIDVIDASCSNFLDAKFGEIFGLIYTFITFIEWFGWVLLIPGLFIFVLVKLIISIKDGNKGGVLAVASLLYSPFVWMYTISTYASRF